MNLQEKRTRLILAIVAAVLVTLFACGQCVFDAGVAYRYQQLVNCVYPPHSCQQP
ncbi:MAG TPA: hypothetical protein VGF38_01515 [Ktedonobacterales bacterium]|jgi:hypothetical protein